MQEWEDPLASISISDFCSDRGTTNQPSLLLPKSYCRDIYIHTLLILFFFFWLMWGFVVKSSFSSSFKKKPNCYSVKTFPAFCRRLEDEKIKLPQSSNHNRWLFREFSTFIVCCLSLRFSDTSGIRVAGLDSLYLLTIASIRVEFLHFFYLSSLSRVPPPSCGAVCHTELRRFQQVPSLDLALPPDSFCVPRDFLVKSDRILMDIATGLVSLQERLSAGEQSETCIMLDGIKIEDHPLRSGQATLGVMLGESRSPAVETSADHCELRAQVKRWTVTPVWMPLLCMHAHCCCVSSHPRPWEPTKVHMYACKRLKQYR